MKKSTVGGAASHFWIIVATLILIVVMPASAAYYTVSPNINQSATIFIGEQGLNVTGALLAANGQPYSTSTVPLNTTIGWWASAANIGQSAPTKTIDLSSRYQSLTVSPSDFVGFTGNWYLYNSTQPNNIALVFAVADPVLALKIWEFDLNYDMTGKSILSGEPIGFGVETNQYAALDKRYRFPVSNSATDGYIDIIVRDESGTTYTTLYNASGLPVPLTRLNVSTQPYYWGSTFSPYIGGWRNNSWATNTMINGHSAYPAGTYTVRVESGLNNMKANYKNAGADYTGKTVSSPQTITIVPDTLTIEANKDSVIVGKPFSVTVTGNPRGTYHLWVTGTGSMTGAYNDQPPFIELNQDGIKFDPAWPIDAGAPGPTIYTNNTGPASDGSYSSGGYHFYNAGSPSMRVWDDIAKGTANEEARTTLGNGSFVNANITLSISGTRTIEFRTTDWTKSQEYVIHVEGGGDSNEPKSAEVVVEVEKWQISVESGDRQQYNLGEKIRLSGYNPGTYHTYLFLTGPNLQAVGSQIQSDNPITHPVINDNAATFKDISVNPDTTWSYLWNTSNIAPYGGNYTIYAISAPKDKNHLSSVSYDSLSVYISNGTYPIDPEAGIPFDNTIRLSSGWNFISTPIRLAPGANNATIFTDIDLAGHSIFTYNTQTATWNRLSSSDTINPLEGIWIYSNGEKTITLTPDTNPLQTPPTKKLYAGWNAIGSTGIYPATARDTLFSVSDKWTTLLGYKNAEQRSDISIINGGSGVYADTRTLNPANGYWLFMKSSGGEIAAISS